MKPVLNRLTALAILLVVLAVTGTIIYFVIPHEDPKAKPAPDAGKSAPAVENKVEQTVEAKSESGAGGKAAATDRAQQKLPPSLAEEDNSPAPTDASEAKADVSAGSGVSDPLERAITVTVRAGDTLEKIAAGHHTTVESIKHFNKLKDNTIRIGQKLKVIPGPWSLTVNKARNELVLEQITDGKRRLFLACPANADGMKNVSATEFAVSFMRRRPDWIAADGSKFKYGDPENPYGEYLIMLARRGRPERPLIGFGIHGVDDKTSNLKNCGRGCIHVDARNIELLYYLVCPGTEVTVTSGETVRNLEK